VVDRKIDLNRAAVIAMVAIGAILIGAVVIARLSHSDLFDPSLAEVTLESCDESGATGTVTNRAGGLATPVVEVAFYGPGGEFIHRASVTRPGMEPGSSAEFSIEFRPDLHDSDVTQPVCEASVPTMFKFRAAEALQGTG